MIVATIAKIQPFVWISRQTSDAADSFRHFAVAKPFFYALTDGRATVPVENQRIKIELFSV